MMLRDRGIKRKRNPKLIFNYPRSGSADRPVLGTGRTGFPVAEALLWASEAPAPAAQSSAAGAGTRARRVSRSRSSARIATPAGAVAASAPGPAGPAAGPPVEPSGPAAAAAGRP